MGVLFCSFFVFAVAACSSETSSPGESANLATCAAGQTSGCRCANGQLPSLTGCGVPQAGTSAISMGGGGAAATVAAVSGTSGGIMQAIAGSGAAGQAEQAGLSAPVAGATGTAGAGGSPLSAAGASGMQNAAGSAGTISGAAGAAGGGGAAGNASDVADCGSGGMVGKASNAGSSKGSGYGSIEFTLSAGNQILRLQTTLEVPVKPNGNSTLFLWPGLEPLQGENYNPIGTGVLQPVLTWGGSCAPGSPQGSPGNWWISSQYVNTLGTDSKFRGCFGGSVLNVKIGDLLAIDMALKDTTWTQTVTDPRGKSVDFSIDMENQPQRWALFEIEAPTSTKPAADVVFTNTVMTFAKSEPAACQPSARGTTDYFSAPVASADGLRCCVSRLVLRAQGVAATTKDP